MRDRMGHRLWEQWLTYLELEPIGFPVQNLMMAYTLATLGNVVGGGRVVGKNRREPYAVDEFLLRTERKAAAPKRMSTKATIEYASAVFAQLGIQGKPLGK